MWVEKYRPESLEDYRGASSEKEEIQKWLENWEKGDKPVLLHGQAGTGKTSMVEALAKDYDRELVETNASDVRTKKKLKSELKEATRQASFLGKQKIILIDEVDGMGRADRGGTSELLDIIKESRFPVVLTANDAYSSNIQSIRNKAKLIELGSVHTNSITAHLKRILENEGIDYDESAVKRIARGSGGQMRSAINDLEAVALSKDKLEVEDLDAISQRDNRQEIFDSLKVIFKTTNPQNAKQATENLDEDADTFLQWIRENIPREYKKPEDVAEAYDQLSNADLFNGRIRIRQHWKLLKYVYFFSSVGVALSKDEKYEGWTKYQYPGKIKRMGQTHAARNRIDSIAGKLSEKMHISKREAKRSLPFLAEVLEDNPELAGDFEFDDKEVDFIKKFSA